MVAFDWSRLVAVGSDSKRFASEADFASCVPGTLVFNFETGLYGLITEQRYYRDVDVVVSRVSMLWPRARPTQEKAERTVVHFMIDLEPERSELLPGGSKQPRARIEVDTSTEWEKWGRADLVDPLTPVHSVDPCDSEDAKRMRAVSWGPEMQVTQLFNQELFDMTIGRLDRVLSELVSYARQGVDGPNSQTLKHHAEDMIAAGQHILKKLGHVEEGTPQPKQQPKQPQVRTAGWDPEANFCGTFELIDQLKIQDVRKWAVKRWQAEVQERPLANVHRRSLDDTWRQVIAYCGGDHRALCGPTHDELLSAQKGEPVFMIEHARLIDDAIFLQEAVRRFFNRPKGKPRTNPPRDFLKTTAAAMHGAVDYIHNTLEQAGFPRQNATKPCHTEPVHVDKAIKATLRRVLGDDGLRDLDRMLNRSGYPLWTFTCEHPTAVVGYATFSIVIGYGIEAVAGSVVVGA